MSFSALAKQLEPSVVNISSTYVQKASAQQFHKKRTPQPQQPEDEDQDDNGMQDFFQRFFGKSVRRAAAARWPAQEFQPGFRRRGRQERLHPDQQPRGREGHARHRSSSTAIRPNTTPR